MGSVSRKILDGVRVVDLSGVLAGPYRGQLLADSGATVIRLESPVGDENRRWPFLPPEGVSANFGSLSGCGALGPLAEKRGYDLMVQAFPAARPYAAARRSSTSPPAWRCTAASSQPG